MMKILVCGGRHYQNHEFLDETLDAISMELQQVVCIIQGGATGADSLARKWAEDRMLPVMEFPANWHRLGKAAGPIRNEWMVEYGEPDLVVAFPGGRGTANMVRLATEAAIAVRMIPR
tara:strand:- start:31267 stop:31620 length:354 start_codon:yes stop_codon:yes gene_type:complete